MSNSILTEISCPNCLAPINLDGHGSSVTCDACHSNYILEGHLCSHCSAYYKDEVAVCGRCGTPMTRHCLKCHTDNWAGDEYCKKCGSAMDLLDIAAHSHQEVASVAGASAAGLSSPLASAGRSSRGRSSRGRSSRERALRGPPRRRSRLARRRSMPLGPVSARPRF